MLRKLSVIATAASICMLGVSGVDADEPNTRRLAAGKPAEWIKTLPILEGFESITAEAGRLSRTTGENIIGESLYLSAYLEGFDGNRPAGFGGNPQQILIFTTTSGQFVIRFLDWPCTC